MMPRLRRRADDRAAVGPLPNFLVIGAQKSGTTWLAQRLREHPDVYLPAREVHYFNHVRNHGRGEAWYRRHFADVAGETAVGEKTPNYLWVTQRPYATHQPHVHLHVHDLLPDARLVVVLREPVARAVSSLRHHVRAGRLPRWSADELLVGRGRALAEEQGVLDMGRYVVGLEAYRTCFDDQQLLILVYEEDVVADPHGGLRRVCEHLGVDPTHRFEDLERPVGAASSAPWRRARRDVGWPSAQTVHQLRAEYADDNRRLFELLGRVPQGWPEQAR